jgi:hypothetical protein
VETGQQPAGQESLFRNAKLMPEYAQSDTHTQKKNKNKRQLDHCLIVYATNCSVRNA